MTSSPTADHPEPAPDGLARLTGIDLAAEPVFLMVRAAALGSSTANQGLAPLGLKVRSYSILAVACSGTGPTQRELGDLLRMRPSQTVAILDELERRGLVERRTDPRDRRSKTVVPTGPGRELYARAKAAVDRAAETSLAALPPQDREDLARLLRRLAF
ncbi:MarR family winged helix-turn-helix transcriptional regulator [Kocuria sp. CH-021]|uniref:MarR family winged helix-turn-helix transcriptional regulator n=1 Tax=Kocuria sp. CH-021 TaxID=3406735 RepID=UPI003C794015